MSLHIDEDSGCSAARAIVAAARLCGSLQADDIAFADTVAAESTEVRNASVARETSAALFVVLCVADSTGPLCTILPATNVVCAGTRIQRGKDRVGIEFRNGHRKANMIALIRCKIGNQVSKRACVNALAKAHSDYAA